MDMSLANELDVLWSNWSPGILFGERDDKKDLCPMLRVAKAP